MWTSMLPTYVPAMLRMGIDEAGYGPTLGPLAVVGALAEVQDPAGFAAELAALGVADSKQVHKPGDLASLERVALPAAAWLSGFQPDTADDLFALLGESAADRAAVPWMAGAEELRLPVAATVSGWSVASGAARGLHGHLLHPRHLNAARRKGVNRAAAELDAVRLLLQAGVADPAVGAEVACDRLGGRKRYGDLLQAAWPGQEVEVIEESAPACRYRCRATSVGFLVGGESQAPLIAAASCIAKYARELHMLLLNRHWSARFAWLKPTAGYPEDAKRWLHQLGEGTIEAWRDELVRS
jgi:ribonuclease HII